MKNIQKYTLMELINKYKDVVGEDIVNIIVSALMPTNKESSEKFREDMKRTVEKVKEILKTSIPEENKKHIIINAIYKNLEYLFEDEKISNNKEIKKRLLMEIHRKFSDKMPKKQRNELLNLILEKEEFVVYNFLSERYPGIAEIGIISRKKPEKISDTKSEYEQEIIKLSLRQALDDGYFENIIKEEYKKDYLSFVTKGIVDFCLKDEKMSVEEYKATLESGLNNNLTDQFERGILEFFKNNYQYVDEESLLLNLGARLILGIKLEKGEKIDEVTSNSEEIHEEDRSIAKSNSIILLKEIYSMLNSKKYKNKEFVILNSNEEIIIKVSKKVIEEFLSKCTNNDYLTDEDIEMIHKDLLQGELTPDMEKREIAGLNIDDLIKMMEICTKKNEDKILPCATELTEYLKTTKGVTNEELIDLYINGQINLELMENINMQEIPEEFFRVKFEDLYSKSLNCKEEEEKKNQFKQLTRLVDLYKLLEQKGNFEINKEELLNYILSNYDGTDMNQSIADFHKLGLIKLEEAIEWTGTDSIMRRYQEEGILKPTELRECYDKGKLTLDDIAEIINIIPENGKKFMMIGGIFPGEEDISDRDILILECMKIEKGVKSKSKGKRNNEFQDPKYYKKYITDPFARLSLIQTLDPEYTFEMLMDGHAVIMLPTLKKVIIEKMLDKNNLPSYGSATYLLDKTYYEDNYEKFIENKKINRTKLIKELGEDGVDRIVHGAKSWGENIKKYFGTNEKSKWTDEDRKKIDDAIGRIKRTHRTI